MEKYGTDLEMLPPTDEQLRLINKLAGTKELKMPRTRQEADKLIEKLGAE